MIDLQRNNLLSDFKNLKSNAINHCYFSKVRSISTPVIYRVSSIINLTDCWVCQYLDDKDGPKIMFHSGKSDHWSKKRDKCLIKRFGILLKISQPLLQINKLNVFGIGTLYLKL